MTNSFEIAPPSVEVMRITSKGIYIREGMEVGAAAKAVIDALSEHISKLVEFERKAALEEAAKVSEARYMGDNNREDMEAKRIAADIRSLTNR